jgi:hypothetical protein
MMKFGVALSAVVLVLASSARAGPTEAMAFAIGTCSAQVDPQARLKCYDDLAAKLKAGEPVAPQASVATPGAAPAPVYTPPPAAVQTSAPPPTAAQNFGNAEPPTGKTESSWYNPGSWFGSDNPAPPHATTGTPAEFGAEYIPQKSKPGEAAETIDQISAKVTGYSFASNGRFTVTLDNGQIWKQIDGDTGIAKFNDKGENTVTISRGFLGSYNLVVEGRNAMFKVKRLQ